MQEKIEALKSDSKHLEDIEGIAKAFTPDEWEVVISIIPSQKLADVLAKRATKGERIYKQMTEIWEGSNGKN